MFLIVVYILACVHIWFIFLLLKDILRSRYVPFCVSLDCLKCGVMMNMVVMVAAWCMQIIDMAHYGHVCWPAESSNFGNGCQPLNWQVKSDRFQTPLIFLNDLHSIEITGTREKCSWEDLCSSINPNVVSRTCATQLTTTCDSNTSGPCGHLHPHAHTHMKTHTL